MARRPGSNPFHGMVGSRRRRHHRGDAALTCSKQHFRMRMYLMSAFEHKSNDNHRGKNQLSNIREKMVQTPVTGF